MRRQLLGAVGVAMVIIGLVATPAGAATGDAGRGDRRISVSGDVVVAEGETVRWSRRVARRTRNGRRRCHRRRVRRQGNLRVNGRVSGDVLVRDGDAIVTGRVRRRDYDRWPRDRKERRARQR